MSMTIMIAITVAIFFIAFFYLNRKRSLVANIARGQAFLESNKQNPLVQSTSSGLQYLVLKPTKPRDQVMLPRSDSTISVHYQGSLLDGTVIESNEAQGKPVEFNLNQVIAGWAEGIQLMQIGEKTRFFIPSHLAYGAQAVGKIKPGSTLVYDIKLVDFY